MYKAKCTSPFTTWVVLSAGILLCRPEEAKCFSLPEAVLFCDYFERPEDGRFFLLKRSLRVPHWVMTVCFIPYVSSVIITPGWFMLLSKCTCLDAHCGELSNCVALKSSCWLRHSWCLTFAPLCHEKGHCYELMTEQCSATLDYPALYLCLLPPTIFSFPCHSKISLTLLPTLFQPRFFSIGSHTAR